MMEEILQRCQSCYRDARGVREMTVMPQRCQSCYRDASDAKESMEEIKENLIKMTNVIIKKTGPAPTLGNMIQCHMEPNPSSYCSN